MRRMSQSTSILGGKSVYCINEGQMRAAQRLASEDPESSRRIHEELARLEETLGRNELAALCFLLLERLRAAPSAARGVSRAEAGT